MAQASSSASAAERIRMGGHRVPTETIRRRYRAGLRNFFNLHRPIKTGWQIYDNSCGQNSMLVATGEGRDKVDVHEPATWSEIKPWSENEQ